MSKSPSKSFYRNLLLACTQSCALPFYLFVPTWVTIIVGSSISPDRSPAGSKFEEVPAIGSSDIPWAMFTLPIMISSVSGSGQTPSIGGSGQALSPGGSGQTPSLGGTRQTPSAGGSGLILSATFRARSQSASLSSKSTSCSRTLEILCQASALFVQECPNLSQKLHLIFVQLAFLWPKDWHKLHFRTSQELLKCLGEPHLWHKVG
ncbi:hypothetical protein FKM82_026048 [Ascaphus truei]